MNPVIRNILAVVVGIIVGSIVNITLVNIGPSIIPLPEGANMTDMKGLAKSMHLLEPKHMIFPFLGHALGTLVGALTAVMIAASHHMKLALGIGAWFLIGGITAVVMLPESPMWFKVLDLVAAYIPMGWLGGKLAGGKVKEAEVLDA